MKPLESENTGEGLPAASGAGVSRVPGALEKQAHAEIALAVGRWRDGSLDDARRILRELASDLVARASEREPGAAVSASFLEDISGRINEALRIQMEAAPAFEKSASHALRGAFHDELALVLRDLAQTQKQADYIERAFIEFTAASTDYERAGDPQYLARVENDLGLLFLASAKLVKAHQHFNRARAVLVKLKDKDALARIDATRARAFLAEGRNSQAEMAAQASIKTLEEGDESALLSEALTFHGVALARLGRHSRAQAQLERAIEVARRASDAERAGVAALTILEELTIYLQPAAMREYYQTAESLLVGTQDIVSGRRLGQCARAILATEHSRASEPKPAAAANADGDDSSAATPATWAGCELDQEVLRFEGELIRRALEASGGSITRAARLLHVTHQGLAFILNNRQKSLLTVRTPIRSRKRSVVRKQRTAGKRRAKYKL